MGSLSSVIHIALLWSAETGWLAFYRHIAPLERKTEHFRLSGKRMDFQ